MQMYSTLLAGKLHQACSHRVSQESHPAALKTFQVWIWIGRVALRAWRKKAKLCEVKKDVSANYCDRDCDGIWERRKRIPGRC